MKYFDSHAHYYDERFESECEKSVDCLIDALRAEEVSYIINVGTSPETSRAAIAQAQGRERMYTALGIHPSDTRFLSDIDSELADIESLIKNPLSKCVCLGEIGLDYHYPETDAVKQMKYFEAQLELARSLKMPVCIHDREAHGDILDTLKRYPDVTGVLHSYSGSCEMARELIDMGYYISFSGTLTFTNARKVREAAARVPREIVMIETDCPYLAPHPFRGRLNHSGYLEYTCRTLAQIFSITEEECAELTDKNARRLFSI